MTEADLIPGARVRHYRNQETYEIIGIGVNSDDAAKRFVVYRGLYTSPEFGENPLWVRPIETFLSQVEIEGRVVDRFELLQ